jgi:hypothetical protein
MMDKDISDTVFLVSDRGTFWCIAERLAREAKRVYYHRPNGEAFETLAQCYMGDGHPNIELVDDFWPFKKDIDVFVFPDCRDSGVQAELISQGFPVWGSKDACQLEQMRGEWENLCKSLGLPFPKTDRVRGVTALRKYLDKHMAERPFLKISRFRGDMETWQAKTPEQVENELDYLAARWGPLKEVVMFYVQQPVETTIEGGSDTYCIGGQYPDEIILGYEKKSESYFATVKKRGDMPPELWSCSEAVTEILAEIGYAGLISSEVRVDKKGLSYWLDPTFRMPSPAGEEQLEMMTNFPRIVSQGAQGILEQPDWAAKYCGEAVIAYTGKRDGWKSFKVPEDIKQWIKPYACAYHDGAYHFPPSQDHEAIGCAVAIGDKPEDVIDGLKDLREQLKDQPVELRIEPIADLIAQIEEAEEKGIEFTDDQMPEPASVLDNGE